MREVERLVDKERSVDSARRLRSRPRAMHRHTDLGRGYELMQDGLTAMHHDLVLHDSTTRPGTSSEAVWELVTPSEVLS